MMIHDLIIVSWIAALVVLVRRRREIVATVRAMPIVWRVVVAALLVVCALIPGPIDDLIVAGLVARVSRSRSNGSRTRTRALYVRRARRTHRITPCERVSDASRLREQSSQQNRRDHSS